MAKEERKYTFELTVTLSEIIDHELIFDLGQNIVDALLDSMDRKGLSPDSDACTEEIELNNEHMFLPIIESV